MSQGTPTEAEQIAARSKELREANPGMNRKTADLAAYREVLNARDAAYHANQTD